MLDLNQIRADFAEFLAGNASKRHSLDAALMYVVEGAYQKGLSDALQVPAVLQNTVTHMDALVEAGNGSQARSEPSQVATAGISGDACRAWQGGGTESGNPAAAPEPMKGGALAKLAGMWCNDPAFQSWLRNRVPEIWAANAGRGGEVGNIDHLIAGNCMRALINVKTRAELDHNPEAAALFKRLILQPYADHLKATKA